MTRKEFFDQLPGIIATKAYHNAGSEVNFEVEVTGMAEALKGAFNIGVTPEGAEYWLSLIYIFNEEQERPVTQLAMLMYDYHRIELCDTAQTHTAANIFLDDDHTREVVTWLDLAKMAKALLTRI